MCVNSWGGVHTPYAIKTTSGPTIHCVTFTYCAHENRNNRYLREHHHYSTLSSQHWPSLVLKMCDAHRMRQKEVRTNGISERKISR